MDGILLIDKPPRITSFDLVHKVKQIIRIKKAGHFGTLDPMATGLMLVALGKATRFFPFYSKLDKVYRGQIRFGYATDTYDADGSPSSAENTNYPSKEALLSKMAERVGQIEQTPPLFSAKKFKGKPLYVLARKDQDIKLKPVQIEIHYFRCLSYDAPYLEFEVSCSTGTYVRSLAHDLGQSLGCGAHLSRLERTAIGNFDIRSSTTLEALEKLVQEEKTEEILIPIGSLLPELPKIILNEEGAALAKNGSVVYAAHIDTQSSESLDFLKIQAAAPQIYRMFHPEGRLMALAKSLPDKDGFHPYLVIDSNDFEE